MTSASSVTECISEGGTDWTVICVDEEEYLAWVDSIENDKIIDRVEARLAAPDPSTKRADPFDFGDQPLQATKMFMSQTDWDDIVKFGKEG
jgi:hypothetical protein